MAAYAYSAINAEGIASGGEVHAPDFEAAREQLAALKVADGLEVTLFASEPMIVNPPNMDVDSRGRVWATEGANYRVWQKWGKLRPEGDRILVLEDTDKDGVAEGVPSVVSEAVDWAPQHWKAISDDVLVPSPKKRTPRMSAPSVTPVAAKMSCLPGARSSAS